ncbi:hypothetical protein M407DRAFT_93883 [Tulasnella calospora MUT 4182]|uniref:Urease accessory protein UreF n=1 Tax=Tulasnella calospora MUT 4182 TaxID=1051891 RepID=A0A0C3QG08_9AGAM|nr:hypothetical protein M407DRAFT_93883 [Tulasnella calospora MUT 4182]
MQAANDDQAAHEAYILLLLSDANLPTGSFVASAGLESYIKHGFFSASAQPEGASLFDNSSSGSLESDPTSFKDMPNPPRLTSATIRFLQDSVQSYARSALPFVGGVHDIVEKVLSSPEDLDNLQEIMQLDTLYESMTLNHVARRASKAQGVALLTLYTKGFSEPLWIPRSRSPLSKAMTSLIEGLKLKIRKGDTPGHLPICWAVLAAALGLTRERSQHLHSFLHARALLSASVRLNTVGPYAAQQLLLHVVQPMVENAVRVSKDLQIRFGQPEVSREGDLELAADEDDGPANTWPLGEILSSRHDQQHSRIFNS